MRRDMIFVRHHEFNIAQDGKPLNIFLDTEKETLRKISELKEINPGSNFKLMRVGNDANDLAMRILSYLEKYYLPEYVIIVDGEVLKKIYHYECTAQDKAEEIKETYPNKKIEIKKIKDKRTYPSGVCLEKKDYNLLKASGKINLEKNTTFGLEIFIDNGPEFRKKKNGKIKFYKTNNDIC